MTRSIQFEVDGRQVEVVDAGQSLLGALRDQLRIVSVKDGCSPQGQCGCCTVLVDDAPRVACVTPLRRVAGKSITTAEGLTPAERQRWGSAFLDRGASQCGFCTPGIICRLAGQERKGADLADREQLDRALAAHVCRCTGWQTIVEAAAGGADTERDRDLDAASRRATLEGGAQQAVATDVAFGHGGFVDDTAPDDALVAVLAGEEWVVDETLDAARRRAGKVQGRRTTLDPQPPLDLPAGDWDVTLQTSWVEPAYLEPDGAWCAPGGEPQCSIANGGAFGGKPPEQAAALGAIARRLADEHGAPVRALWSREDVVRFGPKRPPMAAGMRSDGSGIVRVVRTAGVADRIRRVLPDVDIEEVDLPGPPTDASIRAASWAEAEVLRSALDPALRWVHEPDQGSAQASFDGETITVRVRAGDVLDATVLRSYVIGAAHMAYSWVVSEALVVDESGEIHDLTMRSFGIVRAADMPRVVVEIEAGEGPARRASDAAFAAVAGAVWRQRGLAPTWPTG